MALPDKYQLKFNIYKDVKTLMEDIKKRFGGNKETKKVQKTLLKQQYEKFSGTSSERLDQIHDRLQKLISQLEILGETISQDNINLKFLRSLPSNVSAASSKAPVSTLLNVDCLSDDVIYSFFKRLFSKECRSSTDNRNKEAPRRTVLVEVSTSNDLVSQYDAVGSYDWSFQADEEPTNYTLMAYASSGSSSSSGSDNETSFKNLSELLESQVSDKIGLGYDSQVFNSQVFDYEESDDSVHKSPLNDRYKSGEGYHVVHPLYTGTFMPPKHDMVFNDAPNASETVTNVVNVESSTNKPSKDMSKTLRPDA
nr:hypothetical protein [Tanacetum cinerariifolium]